MPLKLLGMNRVKRWKKKGYKSLEHSVPLHRLKQSTATTNHGTFSDIRKLVENCLRTTHKLLSLSVLVSSQLLQFTTVTMFTKSFNTIQSGKFPWTVKKLLQNKQTDKQTTTENTYTIHLNYKTDTTVLSFSTVLADI